MRLFFFNFTSVVFDFFNLVAVENAAKLLEVVFVKLSLLVCSLQAIHDCG